MVETPVTLPAINTPQPPAGKSPPWFLLSLFFNHLYIALQYMLLCKIMHNASLNPYTHRESECRPDQCPVPVREGGGNWQGAAELPLQEVDGFSLAWDGQGALHPSWLKLPVSSLG